MSEDKRDIYVNREISWLAFNERVLQEAADPTVPILEKLKFLGIFSSNLDEFYRVRVANLHRLIDLMDEEKLKPHRFNPRHVLNQVQEIVFKQRKWFHKLYEGIKKELAERNIFIINEKQVTQTQAVALKQYFRSNVLRKLVPIIVSSEREFPMLKDKLIYLSVRLRHSKGELKDKYAIVEIPTQRVPRFFVFPKMGGKTFIMLLDDVIRYHFADIFTIFDYDVYDSYTFKVTRDAELDLDDDISKSFLQRMSRSLQKRKEGKPVRLTYDKEMAPEMLEFLVEQMALKKSNLVPGARYHNFKDFMNFPRVGKKSFVYPVHKPTVHHHAPKIKGLFNVLRERDLLLHYPYHTFDYNIDLLREAAIDPFVTEIKMTIYRVADPSSIMNALFNAIENGKTVTVLVELQARFDEGANIKWANGLIDAGARVIEGVPNLKVHTKIILIKRKIRGKQERYGVIGTGNFHEKTALTYSDTALYTSNRAILSEVGKVFEFFETNYKTGNYEHLLVAPFYMREQYYKLIDREIDLAQKRRKSYIMIKLNNLVDEGMIDKLYEASKAGVKIKMIIRGVCSLKPGVPGLSENIEVISLVDKFLEHSRIFIFGNGGKEKYYISSADWMRRNISRRLEVSVPIYDLELQQELKDFFNIQWRDNTKARVIDADQKNEYRKVGVRKFRAQEKHEEYFKKKLKTIGSN